MIYRGVLPFVVVNFAALLVITYVPAISMVLLGFGSAITRIPEFASFGRSLSYPLQRAHIIREADDPLANSLGLARQFDSRVPQPNCRMGGLIGHGLDVTDGSSDVADTDSRRVDILGDLAGGRGLLLDRPRDLRGQQVQLANHGQDRLDSRR